jgi:hypothetical protein
MVATVAPLAVGRCLWGWGAGDIMHQQDPVRIRLRVCSDIITLHRQAQQAVERAAKCCGEVARQSAIADCPSAVSFNGVELFLTCCLCWIAAATMAWLLFCPLSLMSWRSGKCAS